MNARQSDSAIEQTSDRDNSQDEQAKVSAIEGGAPCSRVRPEYGIIGPCGGKTGVERTVVKNEPLPPTLKQGQTYIHRGSDKDRRQVVGQCGRLPRDLSSPGDLGMRFSDRFGIERQSPDDWFIISRVDTRLFIDPFLIYATLHIFAGS